MAGPSEETLKRVLAQAPPGLLLDTRWLANRGVSRQLANYYVESGWLEHVTHGVYRRPAPPDMPPSPAPDWVVPLISAEWLGYDIHVGGLTALELYGHAHYLPIGTREVAYLYSDKPPTWLKRLKLRTKLHLRTRRLFADPGVEVEKVRPSRLGSSVLMPWERAVRMSSPERAILEALEEVPRTTGFGAIDMVFEGLANLRPRRLQALLHSCRSVKVKRLFFVFADHHGHAWREHLNPEEFDLGSGDRALVPGGRLHPLYRITVPEALLPPVERRSDGP